MVYQTIFELTVKCSVRICPFYHNYFGEGNLLIVMMVKATGDWIESNWSKYLFFDAGVDGKLKNISFNNSVPTVIETSIQTSTSKNGSLYYCHGFWIGQELQGCRRIRLHLLINTKGKKDTAEQLVYQSKQLVWILCQLLCHLKHTLNLQAK